MAAKESKWSPSTSMLAVYSGRQCVGHLMRRGRAGIEAYNVGGASLGMFGSMHAAVMALAVSHTEAAADVG